MYFRDMMRMTVVLKVGHVYLKLLLTDVFGVKRKYN